MTAPTRRSAGRPLHQLIANHPYRLAITCPDCGTPEYITIPAPTVNTQPGQLHADGHRWTATTPHQCGTSDNDDRETRWQPTHGAA